MQTDMQTSIHTSILPCIHIHTSIYLSHTRYAIHTPYLHHHAFIYSFTHTVCHRFLPPASACKHLNKPWRACKPFNPLGHLIQFSILNIPPTSPIQPSKTQSKLPPATESDYALPMSLSLSLTLSLSISLLSIHPSPSPSLSQPQPSQQCAIAITIAQPLNHHHHHHHHHIPGTRSSRLTRPP